MILKNVKVLGAHEQPDGSFLYVLRLDSLDTRDEIQAEIDAKLNAGGIVRVGGGRIPVPTPIIIDYSGGQFNSPRLNLHGEGNTSTFFLVSGNYALKIIGGKGDGQVNKGVYQDFQIFRDGSRGYGMAIIETAGIKVNNVTLYGLDVGLYLEATQISTFENVHCMFGEIGVVLKQPDVFVTPFDSLSFNQCGFMGRKWGMQGGQLANLSLFQCRVEGCGATKTSGVKGHGGLDLHFGSIPGTSHFALEWGPGLNMAHGWVENNCGEADLILTNDGTSTIVHNITGVPFSRVGKNNWSTNCIKVRNPNGGQTILNLQGCAFAGFNDYKPSADRPYIDADENTEIHGAETCTFGSEIERGDL